MANITRRNERESRELASRSGGAFDRPGRGGFIDPFRMIGDLLRWEPFSELERFGGFPSGGHLPAVDVRETTDSYVFRVDVPGVKDDDIDISVTGNRLIISGEREEEKRNEGDRYHAYESWYGSFSRSFTLPEGADPENVRADIKNGVLNITVPKRPEVQPRRISVSGSNQPGDGGKTGGGQKS
jgi:HSP20 family protein